MDSGKIELLNISSSPEKKKFPEKYTVNISNDCPRLVKFSHHGKWFIAAGVKQSINYYRAPTGLSLFQSKQPSSALCCDIARDNTRIVTGLVNNTVKVFKIVY
jgi:WD40 repeat protein